MELKKGDRVRVEGVVRNVDGRWVTVELKNGTAATGYLMENLTKVEEDD